MTRTAAEVQAEIERAEAKKSRFFSSRGWTGSPVGWRPATDDEWRELHRIDGDLKALREELLVAQRADLDATVSERNRGWAMALREAWLGQDPFAELDEDDYITNRDLERLESWKHLPLDEARRWARVADALERGWY